MRQKKILVVLMALVSLFPLNGTAQGLKLDVHTGANLAGFASGNSYQVQDKEMKLGANLGLGISYETNKKFVYSTGIDFLLTGGSYTAMSDYISDKGGPTEAFPNVNSREIAIQIPVKIGYDFNLGKKWDFIPSIGAYGRYSMVAVKENMTECVDGKSNPSFKWDSFSNYQHNTNQLKAYNRWDVGALVEGKFVYANNYNVTVGYSRGFTNKSSQFNFKNHSYYLTLGYSF